MALYLYPSHMPSWNGQRELYFYIHNFRSYLQMLEDQGVDMRIG